MKEILHVFTIDIKQLPQPFWLKTRIDSDDHIDSKEHADYILRQ